MITTKTHIKKVYTMLQGKAVKMTQVGVSYAEYIDVTGRRRKVWDNVHPIRRLIENMDTNDETLPLLSRVVLDSAVIM